MRRPQFRLSTLFWIMLAVACWFGGMRYGQWRAERRFYRNILQTGPVTPDGKPIPYQRPARIRKSPPTD
jgi:hypothetical protein